jgi:hypothetical protein
MVKTPIIDLGKRAVLGFFLKTTPDICMDIENQSDRWRDQASSRATWTHNSNHKKSLRK